jgi:hypothetical protein
MSGAHGSHAAQTVGFCFKNLILHYRDSGSEGIGYPSGALLHDVRELVAKQELAMRRVRVILAGREVQVRAPGKCNCANGRSVRAYVDSHVGEVCVERGFHLGLNISRKRPSAGLGAQIDLEGIDAGTTLNGRFHLHRADLAAHCAGVDGGKGERANEEDALQYAASRTGRPEPDGQNRGYASHRRRYYPKWYWWLHTPKCTSERGYAVKICCLPWVLKA